MDASGGCGFGSGWPSDGILASRAAGCPGVDWACEALASTSLLSAEGFSFLGVDEGCASITGSNFAGGFVRVALVLGVFDFSSFETCLDLETSAPPSAFSVAFLVDRRFM